MSEQQHTSKIDIQTDRRVCKVCGVAYCVDHRQDKTHPTLVDLPARDALDPMLEGAGFSGSYEVLGRIGAGGMSVVFKARHRILKRVVAIKMLHAHLIRDSMQRKRFEQEAQALFSLEHPNIVSVREFGLTDAGVPYLIMDFLEGQSLAEMLEKDGPLPVDRALKIFLQACDALEHAHGKGIVHRDIKPSNIVICKNEAGGDLVKIVDFGIAKLTQDAGDVNPHLTQTGDVFGSPLYMSPEQCLGHRLDARTDMYALGCVMYETLSGKPPLAADTAIATIHLHTTEMPEPIKIPHCDNRLRARLDEIIFKSLEKEPDKRYQSMNALAADLKELSDCTVYKPGAAVYVQYARWHRRWLNRYRRHPAQFVSITVLLAVLLTTAVIGVVLSLQPMYSHFQPTLLAYQWKWEPIERIPDSAAFDEEYKKLCWLVHMRKVHEGASSPRTIAGNRKVALYCMERGHWAEAITRLNEAHDAMVNNPQADYATKAAVSGDLGDCYMEAKTLDGKSTLPKAMHYYREAVLIYHTEGLLGRQDIVSLLKLARVYFQLNRFDDAAQACAEMRQLRDKQLEDDDAHHEDNAMCAGILGDYYFMQAIALKGSGTDDAFNDAISAAVLSYHNSLSQWKASKGETTDADEQYNEAATRLRLAETYMLTGNYQFAVAEYNLLPASYARENAIVRKDIALARWKAGDYLGALQQFYGAPLRRI